MGGQYLCAADSGTARSLRHTDLQSITPGSDLHCERKPPTSPFHEHLLSACPGQTLLSALGKSGEQDEFSAHVEPSGGASKTYMMCLKLH